MIIYNPQIKMCKENVINAENDYIIFLIYLLVFMHQKTFRDDELFLWVTSVQ